MLAIVQPNGRRVCADCRWYFFQMKGNDYEKLAENDVAAQRAAVILSLIAGFQMMRQMIGLRSLARAEPDALKKILAPVFQMLIDGDRPARSKETLRRRSA